MIIKQSIAGITMILAGIIIGAISGFILIISYMPSGPSEIDRRWYQSYYAKHSFENGTVFFERIDPFEFTSRNHKAVQNGAYAILDGEVEKCGDDLIRIIHKVSNTAFTYLNLTLAKPCTVGEDVKGGSFLGTYTDEGETGGAIK